MFNFTTIKTFESKAAPGVIYKYRVMTQPVRTKLQLELAPFLAEMREIQGELECLMEEIPRDENGQVSSEVPADPRVIAQSLTLNDRVLLLEMTKKAPAYIRACLTEVTGMTIDDTPATVESFLAMAPPVLFDELYKEINGSSETSPKEAQNLESPTTSPAPVEGQSESTSAASVEKTDSTTIETAPDISPTT